jgi:hypothetical protein
MCQPAVRCALKSAIASIPFLYLLLFNASYSFSETNHEVFFKGSDSEVDVYTITGSQPGPTMFILGGIQGDEPGGYLAADLYADISLKKGNLIVVPRANFYSIVENTRGAQGDMNRKFAVSSKAGSDRDVLVIDLIKSLMQKSDFFLNLHDGSGFYSPKWESADRNPAKFGQSIIADSDNYTGPTGKPVPLASLATSVLERVNRQISDSDHLFKFNNHKTVANDTKHKEQRFSATFHALTKLGIPAFGIETSKSISDYRLRVRYQTMVINAFLEQIGIVPDNPKIYLDNPSLKYLIVSINSRTPIVVGANDVLKMNAGDSVRIVHIESNYNRGLTARIKRQDNRFNDLNQDVQIGESTTIQIRKDRFLIGSIPVEVSKENARFASGIHFEPRVKYFGLRVNDRAFLLEPGEKLNVVSGDTITLMDPRTNLESDDEKLIKLDLRGFQAEESPYPKDDRGHQIKTATDLQIKYGRQGEGCVLYALQAKLNSRIIAESFLNVVEPKLEYLVLKNSNGSNLVLYSGDKLEIPVTDMLEIVDIKTNSGEEVPLEISMSGRTVRRQKSDSTGIDGSRLAAQDTPLDIVRCGKNIGRIWIKQGDMLRVVSGEKPKSERLVPVRY